MTTEMQDQKQPQTISDAPAPLKKRRTPARKPKVARKARAAKKAARHVAKTVSARPGSKTARVIALLRKSKGATLAELMKATGWQAHSVRGFLSGSLTKKLGLKIQSDKPTEGARLYSVR
jgi:hypothetical protein